MLYKSPFLLKDVIAKQREDFREGRPKKYSKNQIEHALNLLESHSYKQVGEKTGISKSTLIRAKRKQKQKVKGKFSNSNFEINNSLKFHPH